MHADAETPGLFTSRSSVNCSFVGGETGADFLVISSI